MPARAAALGLAVALLVSACASAPPHRPHDACAIFDQHSSWRRATTRVQKATGVPASVQLAIVYRESSFRHDARPPRRWFLGILPGPRPSSAYGYGQVLDGTWEEYLRDTGVWFADRDDFADVARFIGWYAQQAQRRAGIAPDDARELYAAYQVGIGGYTRGLHQRSPAVLKRAAQVERRAQRYAAQLAGCR